MLFIYKRIRPVLLTATIVLCMFFLGAKPVHADEKTISYISVDCNPGIWYIMPEKNGNENYSRLYSYISVGGEGIDSFFTGNVTVHDSDGHFWGVNSDSIDPEKNYYLSLKLSAKDGYTWPDEVKAVTDPVPVTENLGLRVFFNGFRCTDAYLRMYFSDPYIRIPIGNDISAAKVTLSKTRFVYNRKKQVPSVTKAVLDGRKLTSKNYIISYHDMSNQEVSPINPGDYYVRLKGKGIYGNQVHVPFTIVKSNPMKIRVKNVKIKYKKLKKRAQTINPGKAIKVSNSKGTVTFKLKSAKKGRKKIKLKKAKKYFKVSASSGKIKVKKKLGKGKYILKIKVTASGNEEYGSASKTVTLKIRIK